MDFNCEDFNRFKRRSVMLSGDSGIVEYASNIPDQTYAWHDRVCMK